MPRTPRSDRQARMADVEARPTRGAGFLSADTDAYVLSPVRRRGAEWVRSGSRISVPPRFLGVLAKRLWWFGMALRMLAKSGSLGGGTQDPAAGSPASAAGNPQLPPEDTDEHLFLVVRGCALAQYTGWS